MSAFENISNYLNRILGVKFIYSTGDSIEVLKSERIYVEGYLSYSVTEMELLQKMLNAIQVDLKTTIIDSEFSNESSYFLIFKNNPSKSETYSPRALINNESYKKHAWEYLKSKKSTRL